MENKIKKDSKVYIKLEEMESGLLKNSNVYYFNINEIIAREYWQKRNLMDQLTDKKMNMKIAIIGTGPSGIMAGIIAQQNGLQIIFFDDKSPLSTILPTGGGRCNLAYAEFDNRELINFYPRGKKFLLSTFSQFSTADTLEFFEKIGIQTYIQDDLRIFPTANSSKFVQEKMLKQLNLKNVRFIKEKVLNIENIENKFKLSTKTNTYEYEKIIFAGGIKNNYDLLKILNKQTNLFN